MYSMSNCFIHYTSIEQVKRGLLKASVGFNNIFKVDKNYYLY